ncbi:MAG: hypothetical protein JNK90_28635 [Planctomycetaceae bacterium]|nr:hypothetical protein [Planctomycetaceae bacterium]
MPLNSSDVGAIVLICQQHQQRVRYGVLGAALSARVGNPDPRTQDYAQATVAMINKFFGGTGPAASWVVDETGFPKGYGVPPNPNYDVNWQVNAPLHESIAEFLQWLDTTASGWDNHLISTYP